MRGRQAERGELAERREPGEPGERGSGTVLVLTAVILAAAVAAGGAAVGQAVVARHRAAAAADLAALAAVSGAPGGGAPWCDAAADAAARNGGRLVSCAVQADGSVTVEVVVDIQGPLRPIPVAHGRARAGRQEPAVEPSRGALSPAAKGAP